MKSLLLVVQGAMAVGLNRVAYNRLYEKRVAEMARTGFSLFAFHARLRAVV